MENFFFATFFLKLLIMPILRNERQAALFRTFLFKTFQVAKLFYLGSFNREEFTEQEEEVIVDALYLMDLLLIQEHPEAPPSPSR